MTLAPRVVARAEFARTGVAAPGATPLGNALPNLPTPFQAKRVAHYLWSGLSARIYEVFPLLCRLCGGQMRIFAFIMLVPISAKYSITSW